LLDPEPVLLDPEPVLLDPEPVLLDPEPEVTFPSVGPVLDDEEPVEEEVGAGVFGALIPPEMDIMAMFAALPEEPRTSASTPTTLRPLGARCVACICAVKPTV
jgi:hypothetical protein